MKAVIRQRVLWYCCFCAGCTSNQYEIQITPQGEQFDRSISVAQARGQNLETISPLGQPELERIARSYGQSIPVPVDQWHTFHGRFESRTPQDVGGYGTYAYYASPFGEFVGYLERFRGSDDAVAELEARYRAVDRVVDYLLNWLREEVGEQPQFDPLHRLLDESLRHDLKNLSFYAYTVDLGTASNEQAVQELTARLLQYLTEREYLLPQEVPHWLRALRQKNSQRLGELVQQVLARKLGISAEDPIPEILDGVSDLQLAEESLREYLSSTPEYQQQLAVRQRKDPEADWDPLSLLGDSLVRALLPRGLFRGGDTVTLSIATGEAPDYSNGKWNAETREIGWSLGIETAEVSGGHELPSLCYALWSVPSVDYQISHFGSLLLDGEHLGTFNLWYQGLTLDERAEWDEFVKTLRPSPKLKGQLQAFRFHTARTPETAEELDSLAEPAIELILQQLEALKSVRTFQPIP